MANDIKLLYNNINSLHNKSQLIFNYVENNNIDCALLVETKNKKLTRYRDWTILERLGTIINKNARGGSLAMGKQHLKMGKANPPHLNDPKNECIHFTLPFKTEKLHIFLLYVHPNSILENSILTKALLCNYAMIIGDFNPNAQKKKQLASFLSNSDFVQITTPLTFLMANNPDSTPDLLLCTNNIRNNIHKINHRPLFRSFGY